VVTAPLFTLLMCAISTVNVSKQCSKGLASLFPAARKAELIEESESESEDDDVNHTNMQPRGTLIEGFFDGEDDETPTLLVKSPTLRHHPVMRTLHHHPVMRTLHHQTRNNFDTST
jgi:hypothetical protein